MRLNSFYRKRTPLDDQLIADMCELSLSVYVQIRRSAQKGLDLMSESSSRLRDLTVEADLVDLQSTTSTERGRSSTLASSTLSSVSRSLTMSERHADLLLASLIQLDPTTTL